MSHVVPGDEDLHYSDGSHRWINPGRGSQASWEATMRAHLEQHLAVMDGHPSNGRPLRQPRAMPERGSRIRGTSPRRNAKKPPQDPGRQG